MTRSPERSEVVEPSKPRLLQVLGPGLVTGAADDDPSGIATYSQAGAQFGFDLGWTLVLTVCNIGADLGAMVEATQLLVPRMPTVLLLLLFAFLCAGGQIFMHHKRYVAPFEMAHLVALFLFRGARNCACALGQFFPGIGPSDAYA